MFTRRQFVQNVALVALPAVSLPMFANATWAAGERVHLAKSKLSLEFIRQLRSSEPNIARAFFDHFCTGVETSKLIVQTSGSDLLIQSSQPILGLAKAFDFFVEESRLSNLKIVKPMLLCGQSCPEWLRLAISNRDFTPSTRGNKISIHLEENKPEHLFLARREQRRRQAQDGIEVSIVEMDHYKFWANWTEHELCIVNWATGRSKLANQILITSMQSPWRLSSPGIPAESARIFSLA